MGTAGKIVCLLALCVVAGAVGCRTSAGGPGIELTPETAAKLRRGLTIKEVKRLLGEPTTDTAVSEDLRLLTFRYRAEEEGDRTVLRKIDPERVGRYDAQIYLMFGAEETVVQIRMVGF